jgi:hypothetical protein
MLQNLRVYYRLPLNIYKIINMKSEMLKFSLCLTKAYGGMEVRFHKFLTLAHNGSGQLHAQVE